MVLAIGATIGAAGLVLFLQYRAITTLQLQNQVIVQQLGEQTAVNHPDLWAGRLDLVAQ